MIAGWPEMASSALLDALHRREAARRAGDRRLEAACQRDLDRAVAQARSHDLLSLTESETLLHGPTLKAERMAARLGAGWWSFAG